MKPPSVVDVTTPRAQRMSNSTNMVQSICAFPLIVYHCGRTELVVTVATSPLGSMMLVISSIFRPLQTRLLLDDRKFEVLRHTYTL